MKRTLTFISVALLISLGYNQNLVFNPSFEDSVANPDWGSDVSNMAGWFATRESPDLFSPYCFSPLCHVPSNFVGYQQAYDGISYVGLATYSASPPEYRELMETELTTDLVIGQKYFFSMFISRSDSCPSLMGIGPASNNIGARFSVNTHYMGAPPAINNIAHVYCDTICYNMTNWNRIWGSFVADSAYRYLTLGNFFDDSNTDTADGGDGAMPYAYYFIDMVCVSTDSLECLQEPKQPVSIEQPNIIDEIVVYPNPFVENIYFKPNNSLPFEVIIYDCNLRELLRRSFDTEGMITLSEYSKGVYFYEIKYHHETAKFGKLIRM
jgi:hypothetical protein